MSENQKERLSGNSNGWWRRPLLYLFTALLLGTVAAGFWPRAIEVEAAPVSRGPLTVTVQEEGKTRIRNRYVIAAPISGYLNRPPLRAGTPLAAGTTLLASLEARLSNFLDPRARIQAEAHLQATTAMLSQRAADVARAEAALDLAEKEYARAQSLDAQQIISQQELDDAIAQQRVLSQEYNSARFALQVAQFEVEQARAALQEQMTPEQVGSEPLRLVAPVNGYVLKVYEESARAVEAGTPIMEIGDLRDLEVEIEMLSSDVVAIAEGAAVTLEQWGGNEPISGVVRLIEPGGFTKVSSLGVEEQRVIVHVDFVDPPVSAAQLGDRYRVEARIVTWEGEDVLQVPTGALFRRGNRWMVFAIQNGRAQMKEVRIGHNNGTAAEVIAGLSEDDRVILYPSDSVEDGISVTSF